MNEFAALADPTRRKIVELLAERERSAGEIVARFSISPPAISQHLKVLREAGLIQVRVEGQHRIQMLNFQAIKKIEAWVFHTQRFWEKRLDALEEALMAEDETVSGIAEGEGFEAREAGDLGRSEESEEMEGGTSRQTEVLKVEPSEDVMELPDVEEVNCEDRSDPTAEAALSQRMEEVQGQEGQKPPDGGMLSDDSEVAHTENVESIVDRQQGTFDF